MAARDLVPALQAAVEGFNTVVDGKQPTLDAKFPTARTALDGARESRDGALVARDATNLSRDAAYRDFRSAKANLDHQDLAALAASKAVNAVDVFIYDTSKDSDGGAWRKRCTKTSWFNEPLNAATRGARREFPAVAVLVLEVSKLTIYDGDDPSLPMWMVFDTGLGSVIAYGNDVRAVVAINAQIVVGSAGTGGLSLFSMLEAPYRLIQQNGYYSIPSRGLIANRNAGVPWTPMVNAEPRLVDTRVLDVAVTILPDARLDPVTGLPTPTIAIATEGGVSVLKYDGSVSDHYFLLNYGAVHFDKNHTLFYGSENSQTRFATKEIWAETGFQQSGTYRYTNSPGSSFPCINASIGQNPVDLASSGSVLAFATRQDSRGITQLAHRADDFTKSMVAYTASGYATGWLPGDIRGAFLADTDATDLVGGTDADRSVKNNPLTVNGTITRAPVATGAELVAYSGFSAGNYIEQVDNADLDFGTGDYCFMGWVSADAWSGRAFFDMFNGSNVGLLVSGYGGGLRVFTYTGVGNLAMALISGLPIDLLIFIALKRTNVVTYELFVNGEMVGTSTIAGNTDLSGPLSLLIGKANPNGPLNTYVGGASEMALFRISATAPSADQIRRIYEDEKVLFQENAACTLYGASDAVTALAHDPDTGLLHVGTSAGRSVFKGLRRVANTTQPVTTAISAANGMVIEQ